MYRRDSPSKARSVFSFIEQPKEVEQNLDDSGTDRGYICNTLKVKDLI